MSMSTVDAPRLDLDQLAAVHRMLSGCNVFVHGYAGSGMSLVARTFARMCRAKLAILSPNGRTAIDAEGEAIGRLLDLPVWYTQLEGVGADMDDDDRRRKLSVIDTILIDDIHLVPAHRFQELDRCCRAAADGMLKRMPFGGKQIIVLGDFFQCHDLRCPSLSQSLMDLYGGAYAFNAPAWKDAEFETVMLESVYRQRYQDDLELIHAMRYNEPLCLFDHPHAQRTPHHPLFMEHGGDYLDHLNKICYRPAPPPSTAITLCSSRVKAIEINLASMRKLPGKDITFFGGSRYFPGDSYPTAVYLGLKIGARVIVLASDMDKGYVKGDVGTLMAADGSKATVLLDNGREITVGRITWRSYRHTLARGDNGNPTIKRVPVGCFSQIPLAPCYALSSSMVQGMTLDTAHLSIGDGEMLSPGEFQFLISRLRTLKRLTIDRPLQMEECATDPAVVEFHNWISPLRSGVHDELHYP